VKTDSVSIIENKKPKTFLSRPYQKHRGRVSLEIDKEVLACDAPHCSNLPLNWNEATADPPLENKMEGSTQPLGSGELQVFLFASVATK